VDPRAGLDGQKISSPTGIRSPDRPARSHSLYRLSYRGPQYNKGHLPYLNAFVNQLQLKNILYKHKILSLCATYIYDDVTRRVRLSTYTFCVMFLHNGMT